MNSLKQGHLVLNSKISTKEKQHELVFCQMQKKNEVDSKNHQKFRMNGIPTGTRF